MHALVVDDSSAIRALLGKMLRENGFDILGAANGQDALEKLSAAGDMDLALVDWNMPIMDGLSFVKAVRTVESRKAMRIMMVTTETELARVGTALESGADEYLLKPFTKEALHDKLCLLGFKPS